MPSLLIVTGPPGAGKSTVSALLAQQSDRSVLVEGDRFFDFLAAGAIEPWLPESHRQNEVVTEAAAAATGRFAAAYETIYDGVVGPWFLSTFARATGLVELDYVVILPGVASCVARVGGRVGHGFTDEGATRKMHHEFANAEIEQRHILGGDSMSPHAVARAVQSARSKGDLRYFVDR